TKQDHVHYKFEYGVHDPHTHDIKSHHEERHGKYVTGFYTLKEPDGTTRVVHYRAGPHTGFEAIVEKIGHAHHPHHGHGGHGHHGGTSYVGSRHHSNQGDDDEYEHDY
ncbi:hypothetical protein NQ314_010981, partial [Rhamnusium bicolor]